MALYYLYKDNLFLFHITAEYTESIVLVGIEQKLLKLGNLGL